MNFIKGMVDDNMFILTSSIIAVHLGVLEEVDTTYFHNVLANTFHKCYLQDQAMIGIGLREGVRFEDKDLTTSAFVL